MANKRNYQKELDAKIAGLHGEVPTLLLHSCCAPCSSYVLEYLSQYFSITLFYYNPNIYPPTEYEHRVEEQQRLIRSLPAVIWKQDILDMQEALRCIQEEQRNPIRSLPWKSAQGSERKSWMRSRRLL